MNITNVCIGVFCALALGGCNMPDMETGKRAYMAKDYKTSAEHFRQLADFGLPEAQARLGRQYLSGRGVVKDPRKALALFELAESADGGTQYAKDLASAKTRIGTMALEGELETISPSAGLAMLKEAASLGSPQAMFELGKAYEKGLSVPQDVVKALDYYKMAGALGYGRADYSRAYIYEKGMLVEQDISRAINLYSSAMKKGYAKAGIRRELLEDKQMRENGEREAMNATMPEQQESIAN